MNFNELKKEVYESNLKIVNAKLVILTWGNTSAIDRASGIIAIKPSGMAYNNLNWRDIVLVDLSGNVIDSQFKPSSDTLTHLEIYKGFNEINAIIHTHSVWATIWAQSGKDIPILGTTHADHFQGNVPCIPHLKSKDVQSDYEKNSGVNIVNYFNKREIHPLRMSGCLLEGHGPFIWGSNSEKAVYNSIALEYCAKMAYHSLILNPSINLPIYIIEKHFSRKHGINSYYGQ